MTDLHKKEIEIQVKLDQDTDASFLSILADKNKEIDRLNNKISIQKNQLDYYLQKSTNWEQINRLAKTCESNVDQVNLPVNLAVYNFCKKARIQNRIELLYRYMKKASRKIENTLHIQETLLNGITENVCKLAKNRGYDALACEFGEFIVESKHLELLNNLLVATIALKRELGSYRNCCNRLITIEDERNTIVEQIYSLPAEERINANYLMRLEYEKHDLKNELRIISKKQQQLQQKFSGISNWYKNNIKELVLSTPALDNVQTNAIKLINLTKKHTHCNLKETTESKISIEQILTCIRLSFNQSETNIENTFYGLIKNEIEKETECWKSSYIKELNQKANECNSLHRHLNEITQERNKLYNIIKKLQRQLNEIKVSNKEEISRISMERDSLKKQIDDLEMIRTAYTELVEKQTDMATIKKNYHKQIIEQDKIVAELQDENNILEVQTTYQKNFIQLQSDFINYLSKNNSAGSDTVQYFGKQFVDEYEFHISEENTCCKSITQVNLDDIKTDEDNNVTCYFNEKKSLTLTTLPEYVVNDVNSNEKNNTQIPVNSLINTSDGYNHHIIIQIDASGGSVQVLNNNTVCLEFVNTASATPSKPIIQIDDDCGTDDDNMLMNKDGELNEIPPICCNSLSKEIHIDDEEIY